MCAPKVDGRLPTRLLDIAPRLDLSVILVGTTELMSLPTIPSYATLSHCWGLKEFLRTLSTNILSFKQCIPFEDLPQTFKDAISVARELGIHYIWIDSLCIIQDSQADWRHESALMASVYSNSYFNIAATASDDSSKTFFSARDVGCHSVSIRGPSLDDSQPDDRSSVMVRSSPNLVHRLFSTPSQNTNSTPWNMLGAQLLSRAWVFQERHLAPRTLHFHRSELVLECRAGLRCECAGLDHFDSNPTRNFDDLSFASWYGVVEVFSKLRLTYQSDRLEALTGVADAFWQKLHCSYIKGLWSDDMARGLLWQVTHFGKQNMDEPATKRQSRDIAPTWSWASLVLAEPNKIFFPASENPSFCVDEKFKFLGADPPGSLSPANSQSQSGAILVSCRFLHAILAPIVSDEATHIAVILLQEEIDDFVIVTCQVFVVDCEKQSAMEPSCEIACLLLGNAEENGVGGNSYRVLHLLIVEPSVEVERSWERVGVLNMRENSGSCLELRENTFKLV